MPSNSRTPTTTPTAMPALAPAESPPEEAVDGVDVDVGLRLVDCDLEFAIEEDVEALEVVVV